MNWNSTLLRCAAAAVYGFAVVFLWAGPLNAGQILYTAEGDSTNATDRLTDDGAQNGVFVGAGVTVSSVNPKFGDSAFKLVDSDGSMATHDVIVLPGTTNLGEQFTLALHVKVATNTTQRLFSNYSGSGILSVGELQMDLVAPTTPNGTFTFRIICNTNSVKQIAGAAVSFKDGGYHHLAATYNDGEVRLYFDGAQVAVGTTGNGAVTLSRDLKVGDGENAAAQLVGDVDDILVYTNALPAVAIWRLARMSAESYFLEDPLPALCGVMYTAEGDSTNATDRLTGDGAQNGVFATAGVTVSENNPKFGTHALNFTHIVGGPKPDVIDISGTRFLGKAFTLAAYVDTATSSIQRLFSTFMGGTITPSHLLFDFTPAGTTWSMRLFAGGQSANATVREVTDGGYHHLAATYDNGAIRLYLDGSQVGSNNVTNDTRDVVLVQDLRVGEDPGITAGEQFFGDIDDLVVLLFKALKPEEVMQLKTLGAQKFLDPLPPSGTVILIM